MQIHRQRRKWLCAADPRREQRLHGCFVLLPGGFPALLQPGRLGVLGSVTLLAQGTPNSSAFYSPEDECMSC